MIQLSVLACNTVKLCTGYELFQSDTIGHHLPATLYSLSVGLHATGPLEKRHDWGMDYSVLAMIGPYRILFHIYMVRAMLFRPIIFTLTICSLDKFIA